MSCFDCVTRPEFMYSKFTKVYISNTFVRDRAIQEWFDQYLKRIEN